MKPGNDEPSPQKFRRLRRTQKALGQSVRQMEKTTIRHAKKFVSSRLDRLSAIRRSVFGWITLIVVLAGVSAVQWYSFRQAYTVDIPTSGGTYSEGVLGPLETLNPILARSNAEKSVAKLLFSSLYRYDETGNIKGDLAKSIEVNEDQTVYTVSMHKGATWSDGAPLTANDVVFTVNLLKNPETRSPISGWNAFKVEAKDANTVVFTLPGAYAPFVHSLTFPILPQHSLAGIKPSELRDQSFSQSPVTSGPFALRLVQTITSDGGKRVAHLVANPKYIHGTPKLDRFQIYAYPSREDIERALRTHEITATPELDYESLPEATKRIYQSESYSINDGVYALFNTRSQVLEDRVVREALSISIDREKLRNQLSRPSESLDGPILSNLAEGLPDGPKFDVARARSLLDEAGWKQADGVRKKDGQDLVIKMVALKSAEFSQVTQVLAEAWRENLDAKIDVQIVDPLDPSQSVIQTVLQPRSYDVLIYELVIGGDPDVYAYWHSSQASPEGLNFSNYSNTIADDALSGGRSRVDSQYRDDRYKAFARRWLADVPALGLYQPKINYISSRSAKALNKDTDLVFLESRYINVIYWSVETTSVYKTP